MAEELTDDTIVIEAPSFIAPYIYEKPPPTDINFNDVSSQSTLKFPEIPRGKSNFFYLASAGLGQDLVQEFLHQDNIIYKEHCNVQLPREEINKDFHFEMKICQECSFETESTLILEHHMETIHKTLTNVGTKNPSEIIKDVQEDMAKLEGKSRTHTSSFTCPTFDIREPAVPPLSIRSLKNSLLKPKSNGKDRMKNCNICGKEVKNSLARHIQQAHVSPQDRKHKCEQCGKRFARRLALNDHKNIHTGARPYICEQCGLTFNNGGNISLHIRKVHRGH